MGRQRMKSTRFPGVYRLPDGALVVRAVVLTPDGKQVSRTRTLPAQTSETAAAQMALQFRAEVEAELIAVADKPLLRQADLTVTDFAYSWLKDKVKAIRPSVAVQYEGALSKILPLLGKRQIRDITRRDIAEWVAWAQVQQRTVGKGPNARLEPYSQPTLRAWWRVLRLMMYDAIDDLHLPHNPILRVPPPKVAVGLKRERGTLSLKDVQALLASAKQFVPQRFAEIATMVLTGMRAGEVYALHWTDIDFPKEAIEVQRSHWKGHEGPTKTDDPRIVPLHAELAEILQEHRQYMVREQHPGLKSGLVFPSDFGGYRVPQSIYSAMDVAVEGAGISIHVTPQVLRRTFNTLMMLSGTDRITLRAMMGHSSEEMTRRYAGVNLDVKQQAVTQLFGKKKADDTDA